MMRGDASEIEFFLKLRNIIGEMTEAINAHTEKGRPMRSADNEHDYPQLREMRDEALGRHAAEGIAALHQGQEDGASMPSVQRQFPEGRDCFKATPKEKSSGAVKHLLVVDDLCSNYDVCECGHQKHHHHILGCEVCKCKIFENRYAKADKARDLAFAQPTRDGSTVPMGLCAAQGDTFIAPGRHSFDPVDGSKKMEDEFFLRAINAAPTNHPRIFVHQNGEATIFTKDENGLVFCLGPLEANIEFTKRLAKRTQLEKKSKARNSEV